MDFGVLVLVVSRVCAIALGFGVIGFVGLRLSLVWIWRLCGFGVLVGLVFCGLAVTSVFWFGLSCGWSLF